MNSNMHIVHTKEVRIFREVTGVKKSILQHIFSTVEEAYLTDIHNRTKNSINYTVYYVLTHPQENCWQLIMHKLLEREDIVKKKSYHPREPIATVFLPSKNSLSFPTSP